VFEVDNLNTGDVQVWQTNGTRSGTLMDADLGTTAQIDAVAGVNGTELGIVVNSTTNDVQLVGVG
jgi:hypothetical protein